MELKNRDLDWHHWFARWEAMQNCYVPHRLYRFDLMLKLADLPRKEEVYILDLGCGPGALSFRALRHYPSAHITAADFDPVMLAIGRGVSESDRIQFVQTDFRDTNWWEPYEDRFDLVMSSTALHWLNEEDLKQLYERVYQALKPGGWFFNSDHIASDSPDVQAHYRKLLQVNQQSAFHVVGADDWEEFWRELQRAMGQQIDRSGEELWEGTDNGLPRQFHVETLKGCGFEQVEFHWQDLGEAVIGARKPQG